MVAVASSLVIASWTATHAQDGTSGPPPLKETNCVLVPASDIPDLRATPVTSPAATPATSPVRERQVSATPLGLPTVIGPAATPTAEAASATPVTPPLAETTAPFNVDLLTEDLVEATTSLASCLTEGNFSKVVDHTSPIFRGQLVGTSRPLPESDYVSLATTFPQIEYTILEIMNPELVDDTTATADVVWSLANQVRVDRWTFTLSEVQGLDVWTIDMAAPGTATPSIESTTITVGISDNRYTLYPDTVSDDTVMFHVMNDDPVDHELLVLKLDDGVTSGVLLRTPGPNLPDGVTMIGQATIASEGEGRLLLTGLEPGAYTTVCLLPDESGLPHMASGMETTFTVAAP